MIHCRRDDPQLPFYFCQTRFADNFAQLLYINHSLIQVINQRINTPAIQPEKSNCSVAHSFELTLFFSTERTEQCANKNEYFELIES